MTDRELLFFVKLGLWILSVCVVGYIAYRVQSRRAGGPVKGNLVLFVPLAIMSLLFGMFIYRLVVPAEKLIQSQWVGKPMPLFDLPPATDGVAGLNSRQLADGRPRLVNIFASWCIPCRAEAPQLEALKRSGVPIDGIAVRDRPEDVAAFLRENGNPFDRIGADVQSSVQIALGSSGVPETFLVDGKGVIREQIQGIITDADVPVIKAKLEAMK